jgi:hypothetical protein
MSMNYRPISPTLQNLDYQIDVKNVNVRPVAEKMKSKIISEAEQHPPRHQEDRKTF